MTKFLFRKGMVFVVIGLFIGAGVVPSISSDNPKSRTTIYVDDDNTGGPWDGTQEHPYQYIQDGVDAANSGDTIIVLDGMYTENVNVYKSLTIRSEIGADVTIVQAADSGDHVFEITADYVNISGFKVTGVAIGWKAAIYLYYTDYCHIFNNIVSVYPGSSYGIYLDYSSNNTISNNEVSESGYHGIYLRSSDSNDISNNIITENSQKGIWLYYSDSNNITNNTCSDNGGGIELKSSANNKIRENLFSSNGIEGISIWVCHNTNYIENNTCNSNGARGIFMDGSDNQRIIGNSCTGNYKGIFLSYGSSENIITNNTCSNNNYGIWFGSPSASNNVIYLNNFINSINSNVNSYNSINIWNSSEKITYIHNGNSYTNYLGNYWDDYTGSDDNGDGIGDTPYLIPDGSNQDNYPLMEPWGVGNQPVADLKLYIDDASISHGVIWKAPTDRVDVVVNIFNPSDSVMLSSMKVEVEFEDETLPSGSLVSCFVRDDFADLNIVNVKPLCDQVGNTFEIDLPYVLTYGLGLQVVFRVTIPSNSIPSGSNSKRSDINVMLTYGVDGNYSESDSDYVQITSYFDGIILTNRNALYRKFGDGSGTEGGSNVDVRSLLKYIYDVAENDLFGERMCIVYYVDHYDDIVSSDLTNWDNIDINWNNPNKESNDIDYLIEIFIGKSSSASLISPTIMIIGGDEIIPFYRQMDNSNLAEEDQENSWSSGCDNENNPVFYTYYQNMYLTDIYYSDINGGAWEGNVEWPVGRIAGANANDMRKFIESGILGPVKTNRVILASLQDEGGWFDDDWRDTSDAENCLNDIWTVDTSLCGDSWDYNDVRSEWSNVFSIFMHWGHASYNGLGCAVGDNVACGVFPTSHDWNSLWAIEGCHAGIPVSPGLGWNPNIGDNSIFSLANGDCSGVMASSAFSFLIPWRYDMDWGEELLNLFAQKLVGGSGSYYSNNAGLALINAKKSYDGWPFWDDKDTKTMIAFNYFGVPWMKVPFSTVKTMSTKEENLNSDISYNISNPFQLRNRNISRIIEINVSGYNITSSPVFDIITINGTQLSSATVKPVIPVGKIPILLPTNISYLNIEMMDNSSSFIGYYNLPCINASSDGNGSVGYSNITDVIGYYPNVSFGFELLNNTDNKLLNIYFSPLKHNPSSNETILYEYFKLNMTYNIETPVVVKNFNMNHYFAMGEVIEGEVYLENCGVDLLSDLILNLSMKHTINNITLFNYSSPFYLKGGNSTNISISISETAPAGGRYIIKVEVLDGNNSLLAETYSDVYISSGGIINVEYPNRINPNDPFNISVLFRNDNIIDAFATAEVCLFDEYDNEVAVLMGPPVTIPSGETGFINLSLINTSSLVEGRYLIVSHVFANGEEYSYSDSWLFIDGSPPVITNVSCIPSVQYLFKGVNISCSVIDNLGLSSVIINVSSPEGFYSESYSMRKVSNGNIYYLNTSFNVTGLYEYQVVANDISGQSTISEVHGFEILYGMIADFIYVPLQPSTQDEIHFTDLSVYCSLVNWSWNFDDGNTSTLQNPTHIYTSNCRYHVTLTVTDNYGAASSHSKLIPVGLDLMQMQGLSEGWNLVSLPFNQSIVKDDFIVKYDGYYYSLSDGIISNFIFGWDRNGQSYTFSDVLNSGEGYWAYSYDGCELWIESFSPVYDEYVTDLETGWNLMGIPYYENISKDDILVDDTYWDTAVDNGWVSDFVFGWNRFGQSYNFADTLVPGYAYWMYAYQPCTLKRVV